MFTKITTTCWAYFFELIESTLPIGSGLDRVNYAQVGGATQSKEHSELRIRLAESTLSAQKNRHIKAVLFGLSYWVKSTDVTRLIVL